MSNWMASTIEPTEDLKDLRVHEGDKRKGGVKAQMEAATEAAAIVMDTFEGPALVSLSGHAADEEQDFDRVTIEVARVSG